MLYQNSPNRHKNESEIRKMHRTGQKNDYVRNIRETNSNGKLIKLLDCFQITKSVQLNFTIYGSNQCLIMPKPSVSLV